MLENLRFLDSLLLAAIDKKPVDLSRADESEVNRTRSAIKKAIAPDGAVLRIPVKRSDFLAACHDITHGKGEEHLIVGYGFRRGNTTAIERLCHVIGSERRVDVPPYVRKEILRHHRHRTDAEVIVFHNHPRTGDEGSLVYLIKALLDDLPIASHADRQMLRQYAFDAIGILRELLGGGRIRFFLGESGYVSEFTLPPALPHLVQFLNSIPPRPPTGQDSSA